MKSNFTQVPNEIIVDVSLSPLARLLYIYMLSMKDGWSFYRSAMANVLCCSRHTLNNAMRELLDAGLVEKHGQTQKGKKGFGAVRYVVKFNDHIANDHIANDHINFNHLTILIINKT